MSGIAIKVQDLAKSYRLRHGQGGNQTFRESLAQKYKSLMSPSQWKKDTVEDFWAIKDISFQIKSGECVGIIGRNGAGKSTLLKLLSRITPPTKGRIELHGRVGSLLEVGTGFHQELSGRENIYLNGTILGMGRKEIARKFDEIVDFAGIGKFLDTPVKRYSSGMYVRLAFAVAAHLEPEILIVDEVLAVGDVQFQEKCIGKMKDIAKQQQRTVLFVSHNMQAIRTLCSRSILIDNGQVCMDGETVTTINGYNSLMKSRKIDASTDINVYRLRRGEGAIRFTSFEVIDGQGNPTFNFNMGETICFKITYEIFKEIDGVRFSAYFKSSFTKEYVTSVDHILNENKVPVGTKGEAIIELPGIQLRPGDYPLKLHLGDKDNSEKSVDTVDEMTLPISINVKERGLYDGFDTRSPAGYVSLASNVKENKVFKGE